MTVTESDALIQRRGVLLTHPLYRELTTPERIRIFMKHHVFAVWDFFSLLKRLQREVTCVTVPWLPPPAPAHARFITEIVLAEECDEGFGDGYISHFSLYLAAMDEMGADREPIDKFVAAVEGGASPFAALEDPAIPSTVRAFVAHTLRVALDGEPHTVAASFCHGRENLLADVLGAVQSGLGAAVDETPVFKHYLERHVTLDHDLHGPLALRLLDSFCGERRERIAEADMTGVEAIEARCGLWDGVLEEIRAASPTGSLSAV